MPRRFKKYYPKSLRHTPQKNGRYAPGENSGSDGCVWCKQGRNGLICDRCVYLFRRILQSTRWTRYRKVFFSDVSNATCAMCDASATDIHHIKDWRNFPSMFWVPENHQGLCHSCHSTLTGMARFAREVEGD